MSRTIRKRSVALTTFLSQDWGGFGDCLKGNPDITIENRKAFYKYADTGDSNKRFSMCLPKHFRKSVNKKRRARDKSALYNEVYKDKAVNYDPWNCTTNDIWSYF